MTRANDTSVLEKLRSAIVGHLATIKAYDLPKACSDLGLAEGTESEAFQSKEKYVERRLRDFDLSQLQSLAATILSTKPNFFLQEGLDLSRQGSGARITELTRRNLIDHFGSLSRVSGKLDLTEFLSRVWPLKEMSSSDSRLTSAEGDIWQHMINNDDWSTEYLFRYLGLHTASDSLVCRFLEASVHPVVREGDEQERLVAQLNEFLTPDGYRLLEGPAVSGRPTYQVRPSRPGVRGATKNLIFASSGPKPELVLLDALNNDVQITANAQYCLVFEERIPTDGLRWAQLLHWWEVLHPNDGATSARNLYKRLRLSLASEPEHVLFKTYYKTFQRSLGPRMPALIPQVYLHFDPMTQRQRKAPGPLARQRMDFLLLLSPSDRIVLEVDGQQHYAKDGRPSPDTYAELTSEDRRLKLAGYEVFRFGASELTSATSQATVANFFRSLFEKYGVIAG
jgi:very-short-patch-repair endonuclease